MRKNLRVLALLLISVAITSSCTTKAGRFGTVNKFSFPNSNVIPIGPVFGESTRTRIWFAKRIDREMYEEAINAALAQTEGDILINYKWTAERTAIPTLPLPIFITTLRVDGIAAKMELVTQ